MPDQYRFIFKIQVKYYLICEVSLNSQLVLSNVSHVLMEFYNIPSDFFISLFRNYISSPLDFFTKYIPVHILFIFLLCLWYRRHSKPILAVTGKVSYKYRIISPKTRALISALLQTNCVILGELFILAGHQLLICKLGDENWMRQCSWDSLRCPGGYNSNKGMNGKLDGRGTQACKLHALFSLRDADLLICLFSIYD